MDDFRGSESSLPLLIVQVDGTQDETTGDFYYRTYAPGVGMAYCEDISVINLIYFHRLRRDTMLDADVLVLNNICDADLLPVIKNRKSLGRPTVYELCDDLWALPATNPMRAFYDQSNNLLLIKRLANYCNALQFSSPELEKKFGYLNPHTRVFPNHILEVPRERGRTAHSGVVVGWGGSIGHLQDMARIADRLVRWVLSRDGVQLCLMCDDPIWRLFDALPADRKRWFATGSLTDYYSFLSRVDIGIAPLDDIPFNRSRSDVKFIEYAAHGVVPVVQATGPYLFSVEHGRTGFLYRSADELISTLDSLVDSASLRLRIAASARAYVLRERVFVERARDRVEFYRGLVSASNGGRGLSKRKSAGMLERLCSCAGAVKRGRHLLLGATRYERLLQAGILAADPSNPSEANGMFEEALRIEPSLYFPYLFGAFVSGDPVRSLERAVEMEPLSIVSRIHLGKAYLSKGMNADAVRSFKAAAEIFPEYELPFIECANCLRQMGMEQAGVDLLKKALDLIPPVLRGPETRAP